MDVQTRVGKALGRQQIIGFHTYFNFFFHQMIRLQLLHEYIMDYIGFLLKIPPNKRFHTFLGDLTPFFTPFSIFFSIIGSAYLIATRIYMVNKGFILKIPQNQRFHTFFGDLKPFFTPFSTFFPHHMIRLLNC